MLKTLEDFKTYFQAKNGFPMNDTQEQAVVSMLRGEKFWWPLIYRNNDWRGHGKTLFLATFGPFLHYERMKLVDETLYHGPWA